MYQVLELANLSNRQRKYFEVIFQEINVNPNNPRVPSQIVVPLFKASSLEFLVWKEIWKLSCAQADSLSLLEFIICLKFITLAQNEKKLQHDQLEFTKNLPLPKFSNLKVDPENFNGIKDAVNEQQILNQKHKKFETELTQNLQNYENLIKKHTQKEIIETLDQSDAKTFYKIFNIHYYAISLIWNLCDINSSGKLEPGAIIVSIHLIKLYLKNIESPQKLSQFYVNFIKNYNKKKSVQQQPQEQEFVNRVHKVSPQIKALQDENDKLLNDEHQKKLGYIQKLIAQVNQNTDKLSIMKVSFYDTITRNSLVKRNIQESLLKNLEISRQKLKEQYSLKQKLEVSLKKMKQHLDHDDFSNDNQKLDKKKYEKIIQKLKLYCEQDYNELFEEIQMDNDPTEIEFPLEKFKKSDTILAQENEEDEEQIVFEGPDFSDTRSNEQIKLPEQPQMNFSKNTNKIVETQSEIIKIETKKNEFEPDFDFDNFGEAEENDVNFETNFDF